MTNIDVDGLRPLLKELKGPLFRDVNRELRAHAYGIAKEMAPQIAVAVAQSPAPQAAAVAATVRAHSDRIPVVAVGKTNPKLKGFTRRGTRRDGKPRADPKARRGQLAHGVVYGPLGGRRATGVHENYYRTPRDVSGGVLGRSLDPSGPVFARAAEQYLDAFQKVLTRHGFTGPKHEWNGHG